MLLQNGEQLFESYISKTDSFDVVYNEKLATSEIVISS